MITQAYIFSTLGKAVFLEKETWFVIDIEEPNLVRPWHNFDYNLLSINSTEILPINKIITRQQIINQLQQESIKQEALTLALQLMDNTIESDVIKNKIAALLIDYSAQKGVVHFLECRLISTPIPPSFNPQIAVTIYSALKHSKLANLFKLLSNHSDEIEAFRLSWTGIAKNDFVNADKANASLSFLVNKGIATSIIRSLAKKDLRLFDNALKKAYTALRNESLIDNNLPLLNLRVDLFPRFNRAIDNMVDPIKDVQAIPQQSNQKKSRRKRRERNKPLKIGIQRTSGAYHLIKPDQKLYDIANNIIYSLQGGQEHIANELILNFFVHNQLNQAETERAFSMCMVSMLVHKRGFAKYSYYILQIAHELSPEDPLINAQLVEFKRARRSLRGMTALYNKPLVRVSAMPRNRRNRNRPFSPLNMNEIKASAADLESAIFLNNKKSKQNSVKFERRRTHLTK
jgi:hypothetical protein